MFKVLTTDITEGVAAKPRAFYLPIEHSDYLGDKRTYVVLSMQGALFAALFAIGAVLISLFLTASTNEISGWGVLALGLVGMIPTFAGVMEYFLRYRNILEESQQTHFENLHLVKVWLWEQRLYTIYAKGRGTSGPMYIEWLKARALEDFPMLNPKHIEVVEYIAGHKRVCGIRFPAPHTTPMYSNPVYAPVAELSL